MAKCNVCKKGMAEFVGYDVPVKMGGGLGRPHYVYKCTYIPCGAERREPVPRDWWIEHPQVMRQTGGYIQGHKL